MIKYMRTLAAACLIFATQAAFLPQEAVGAEDPEYCIKGPESLLVHMRDGPNANSQEAGLARGGDCGMSKIRCSGALRIPTKPATHSNRKSATDSDLKPAGVPI